jgi:AcrR family transcriptional regulator
VAAGTFYNHFGDKGELFREIASEAVAELNRRLEAVNNPGERFRDGVQAHAEALVGFAADHRDLIRILFSREADTVAVQADVLDELARGIAQNRRALIAAGEMPAELDPDVLSQALVGMWARVVAWWAADPTRAPRERVVDTLTRIQLSGTHPG